MRAPAARERHGDAGGAQDQLGGDKPYSQFDLGGPYELSEAVSLDAAVYKLLDKDFVDSLPDRSNGQLAYANSRSTSGAGRRLWMSVNVGFRAQARDCE